MSTTTQLLRRLEAIFKANNSPMLAHFNPGLPKEEVIAFLTAHDIKPVPALVALYEWHNGVMTAYGFFNSVLELLPFGTLFNLKEMLQIREIFREWAVKDFEVLDNYIPFLGSGESDMFLLNLSTGEVLAYQPMIQIDGELAFHSIDTLLYCLCLPNIQRTIWQNIYSHLQLQALDIAIDQLPDNCREVYLLHREQGLSYREIATHLKVSVSMVEKYMSKAIRLLSKDLLSDYGWYYCWWQRMGLFN